MSLRAAVLVISLFAFAPLAAAGPSESEEARSRQLAANLTVALNASTRAEDGSLADSFARTAKRWAYNPQTAVEDRMRLKGAVGCVRDLFKAPQVALQTSYFRVLKEMLTAVMGPNAPRLLGKIRVALIREAAQLRAAARDAGSTPENELLVTFHGKEYGWIAVRGVDTLVQLDPARSTRNGPRRPGQARPGRSQRSLPAGHSAVQRDARAGQPAPRSTGRAAPAHTSHAGAPVPGDVDPRNLDGLEPAFRDKVVRILRRLQSQGWKARVGSGRRSLAQQKEKVRKGYSKTLKSWHLKGLAADIIDSRWGWGGEASNLDHPFWNALGKAAAIEGLTWGGNWKSFRDVAHVQDDGKNRPQPAPTPRPTQPPFNRLR